MKELLELDILEMFESHKDLVNTFELVHNSEQEFEEDTVANMILGDLTKMNIRLNNLYKTFDEMYDE
jgi:hypothetical protein